MTLQDLLTEIEQHEKRIGELHESITDARLKDLYSKEREEKEVIIAKHMEILLSELKPEDNLIDWVIRQSNDGKKVKDYEHIVNAGTEILCEYFDLYLCFRVLQLKMAESPEKLVIIVGGDHGRYIGSVFQNPSYNLGYKRLFFYSEEYSDYYAETYLLKTFPEEYFNYMNHGATRLEATFAIKAIWELVVDILYVAVRKMVVEQRRSVFLEEFI